MAFFPLTLPFTDRDPARSRSRSRSARNGRATGVSLLAFFIGVSLAAVANAAIIWIAYRFADRLTAMMGATARQVVVRLSAFLLLCIGVQILVTAVGDLVDEVARAFERVSQVRMPGPPFPPGRARDTA